MRQVVVDASVAAKWVIEEAHSPQAERLLTFDARYAPDHWRAEAVNVLWAKVYRGDLTSADAKDRMTVLQRAPMIEIPIATLMPRAFSIAVAHMVTVYDALYLALAEERDVGFVTADERLIRRMEGDPTWARRMIWVGDLTT